MDAGRCTRQVGDRLGGEGGGAQANVVACTPWPDAPRGGSKDSRVGWSCPRRHGLFGES
jgi:hypothetical protein